MQRLDFFGVENVKQLHLILLTASKKMEKKLRCNLVVVATELLLNITVNYFNVEKSACCKWNKVE